MHKGTRKSVQVWGVEVPLDKNGRRSWPDAIKQQARAKLASGETLTSIAKEIGASQGLVSNWVNKSTAICPPPSFVEVTMAPAPKLGSVQDATCILGIGDVSLEVPDGLAGSRLTELIRAARASL